MAMHDMAELGDRQYVPRGRREAFRSALAEEATNHVGARCRSQFDGGASDQHFDSRMRDAELVRDELFRVSERGRLPQLNATSLRS